MSHDDLHLYIIDEWEKLYEIHQSYLRALYYMWYISVYTGYWRLFTLLHIHCLQMELGEQVVSAGVVIAVWSILYSCSPYPFPSPHAWNLVNRLFQQVWWLSCGAYYTLVLPTPSHPIYIPHIMYIYKMHTSFCNALIHKNSNKSSYLWFYIRIFAYNIDLTI